MYPKIFSSGNAVPKEDTSLGYKVEGDNRWILTNDSCVSNSTCLVIPLSQLENISPEEIGRRVLNFKESGRVAEVHFWACWTLMTCKYSKLRDLAKHSVREDGKAYQSEYYKPFLGRTESIDAAFALCLEIEEFKAEKEAIAKFSKKERAKATSRHDLLFIGIGKRDGFHCAKCQATKNLHIDHITPVSKGGATILENLQLLCATCNLKKGNRQ